MSMKKIARNKNGDDVLALLGPLANRITSEHWEVYSDQAQYERLIRGEKADCTLTTYSLLKPSIFNGFKKVVVASACMPETMFHRLFVARGIDLKPVSEKLRADLRYDRHEHGDRITIYYACEEAWSKRYRDKLVEDEATGTPMKLLDRVKRAVLDLIEGEPVLWMGNKDIDDAFFGPTAERLPNTPHGRNDFQGVHNVVVISALNPPPQHFHFMDGWSINGDEVRSAHYRTAVYQAVMRCSIRNPQDATPKRVVVMDRDTAAWLADLFPGAGIEPLPGMGVVPRKGKAGRPRQHASDAAKTRKYRENKKRTYLAQLDLINGTSFVTGKYPWFDQEVRSEMKEFSCDEFPLIEGDIVTAPALASSVSGTAYATIYDARPLDYLDYEDDDSFVEGLRLFHERQVAKEDAGLLSPAHFDPDKTAETCRGLDNITHVRGIWLDNDGGDLSPSAFADLFPYLRVVIWNTYSSTAAKPRWRAFIPTTCAMSIEVHRLIMAQIEQVLNRSGFWGKRQLEKRKGIKDPRCHGFDESKFNAASLFYLPCQAKDPKDSFFIDYGATDPKRGPLDLHQWIERCILDLRPEPEPVPVATKPELPAKPIVLPEMDEGPSVERVASTLAAIRDKLRAEQVQSHAGRQQALIDKAVATWRSTPRGMGHSEFFRLGAALHRAGLDHIDIEVTLRNEAAFASSPSERRAEIKGIIQSLSRRGRF